MPEKELFVDQRDESRHFLAPAGGHLEIEGAGKVQPFQILPPVEAEMQIAPRAFYDHVNFVVGRPLHRPLVRGCYFLDLVDWIRKFLIQRPHRGHRNPRSSCLSREGLTVMPRITHSPNLPEPIRRFKGADSQLGDSPHLLRIYG